MNKGEIIVHPLRGRIMMLLAGRSLTTRQLAALLPDVPLPSLYRHLRILLDSEAVAVVGEKGEGRSAERIYSRNEGAGELTKQDIENASPAERMELYSAFLGLLLAQIQVSLRQIPLHESSAYLCGASPLSLPTNRCAEFKAELRALIERYQDDLQTGEERVTFATLLFPEPAISPDLRPVPEVDRGPTNSLP